MKLGVADDRAAGDEAVRRRVRRDLAEDLPEDPALHLLQTQLRRLDHAGQARRRVDREIAVVAQPLTLDRALETADVGQPRELAVAQFQPLRELRDRPIGGTGHAARRAAVRDPTAAAERRRSGGAGPSGRPAADLLVEELDDQRQQLAAASTGATRNTATTRWASAGIQLGQRPKQAAPLSASGSTRPGRVQECAGELGGEPVSIIGRCHGQT